MSAPAQTISSHRLRMQGEMLPEYAQILTPDAVALVSELVERFAPQRNELLKQRVAGPINRDGPNASGLPMGGKNLDAAYKLAKFMGGPDAA